MRMHARSHSTYTHAHSCTPEQAVYDAAAGEFVITTPRDEASKYWIGGSGQHGKVCAVFAQLTVRGEWQVRTRAPPVVPHSLV